MVNGLQYNVGGVTTVELCVVYHLTWSPPLVLTTTTDDIIEN